VPVRVVDVRKVRVGMDERFMHVRMSVRFAAIPGEVVLVPVMLIVPVRVLVPHR
jgi:hypothetical protein